MSHSGRSPGPISDQTFDIGFKIGAAGGIACVGLLYWAGVLSLASPFHATMTLALFPVYLLSIAVLLGLWLGYDTDETNLTRVIVENDPDESERPPRSRDGP